MNGCQIVGIIALVGIILIVATPLILSWWHNKYNPPSKSTSWSTLGSIPSRPPPPAPMNPTHFKKSKKFRGFTE